MIRNVFNYYKPKSLSEACAILTQSENKIKLLAGGTSVVLNKDLGGRAILDLKGLKLSYIKNNKNKIIIGSTTTIADLLESDIIKNYSEGIIYKAAYNIASTPLKNLITVGGNIVQLYPWSDLPLVLLLIDAKVKLVSKTKTRIIKISSIFKSHPTRTIKNDEILTEIIIDQDKDYKGSFIKFAKTSFDYAILDAAVITKIKMNKFKYIKAGISACGPLPQILLKSSNILIDKKINDIDSINKFLLNCIEETNINKDKRVSVEYKKEILPVIIKRALNETIKASRK